MTGQHEASGDTLNTVQYMDQYQLALKSLEDAQLSKDDLISHISGLTSKLESIAQQRDVIGLRILNSYIAHVKALREHAEQKRRRTYLPGNIL